MMPQNNIAFKNKGDILVVEVKHWDGSPEQIQGAEQEFLDIVSSDDYRGVVTDLGDVALGAETQKHIRESWTQLIEETDFERFAYVSEGAGAMATNANIESDVATKAFTDRSEAIEWARSP
ncbi:hypothetical protein [Halomicrobium katesii]|uniref:hypothetical protein n=1 Tax=Halomicrobium katesii TaxID=437163 RepID=UPI0003799E98|nr:hypothetical protein [Halomicrobium katesii]